MLHNKRSHRNEKPTHRNEEWPLLIATTESPHAATKTQCSQKGRRFEPWSGKIPHAAEQLSPCATTAELLHLEPVLRNKRSHRNEKPAYRNEE
ncbi:hypothetical protein J1605_021265 [Eschrichtius robustus]|uniref:Uncharacterized protein n=1 Tax=Eschrichtius robustus TaxID=9764 RepID=A0AB34HCV1_ESCRO|nr:hypothetical protein J1605_021265 [Eschrichtius robustus]